MKYSRLPYVLTNAEKEKIELRESTFQAENPDKQWTQVVVITTKGRKTNIHSDVAKKTLTLDDLFPDFAQIRKPIPPGGVFRLC